MEGPGERKMVVGLGNGWLHKKKRISEKLKAPNIFTNPPVSYTLTLLRTWRNVPSI